MEFVDSFKKNIFHIDKNSFKSSCLEVFDYQFQQCDVYQTYCKALGKNPTNVQQIHEIPFLPIELFKNHTIKSGSWSEQSIFKSSGTTKTGRSQHYVKDLKFYHSICKEGFKGYFGELKDLQIFSLLPSYEEQGESSLVEMVFFLQNNSLTPPKSSYSNHQVLLKDISNSSSKIALIGVAFSLLEMAEKHTIRLENVEIIETGGMKGRRKEITREELHRKLKSSFSKTSIHSEYGMTELFSQAYGKNGKFRFPAWCDILIRDVNDPFSYLESGKTGGLNIIDLANIDSCSFIETKDLGKAANSEFEVLGRFDNSDIRGCNLMF